jgi:hypothetical protein
MTKEDEKDYKIIADSKLEYDCDVEYLGPDRYCTILKLTDPDNTIEFETLDSKLSENRLIVTQTLLLLERTIAVTLPTVCGECFNIPRIVHSSAFAVRPSVMHYCVVVVRETYHGKSFAVIIDFTENRSAVLLLQHSYEEFGGDAYFDFNEITAHMVLMCQSKIDGQHYYVVRLTDLAMVDHAIKPEKYILHTTISDDGELMMIRMPENREAMEVYVRREGLWLMLDNVERIPGDFTEDVDVPTIEVGGGKIVVFDRYQWKPKWTIVLYYSYGSKRELPRD